MLVTVDEKDRPKFDFRPLDVVRWETMTLDADKAESGYDVIRLFEKELAGSIAVNGGMPLAVRVIVAGRTPAHDDLLAGVEKWTEEFRAAALAAGSGGVWVEKVKFKTAPPLTEMRDASAEGAMGVFAALLDEIAADPRSFPDLAMDLHTLESRLPPELKFGDGAFQPDDPDWLRNVLAQVRPMLLQRLLKKGGA
jgi:DNA repair protein SbcD/Mre11